MQTAFQKNIILHLILNFIKRFLLIFFFIYPFKVHSQIINDSLTLSFDKSNSLTTIFDKQINTYNFNTSLLLNKNFNRINFGINERFNSTLIRSNVSNIKDEQYLRAGTEYEFSDRFKIGINAFNNIFSDNRKIAINQASVLNSFLYSKIKITNEVNLNPFFGFSQNTQIGEIDKGILFGSEVSVFKKFNDDLVLDSYLKYYDENISPRKNSDHLLNFNIQNNFDNDITNLLSINLMQARKDFYFGADSFIIKDYNVVNNIQSRTESNYNFQNKFFYPDIFKNINFYFTGSAQFRNIDRDTKYRSSRYISASQFDVDVSELRLQLESTTEYRSKIFNGNFGVLYNEREEKHRPNDFEIDNIFLKEEKDKAFENKEISESQKNNISKRASFNFTGNLNLSESNLLTFNISQNKLKYDTPSEMNFDDRDEILSYFKIRYDHIFNPYFTFYTGSELSLNHTVYIFSERSSNNNYKRIINFNTGGIYSGKNIRSVNEFSVSANYTVYDFEDLVPNVRSFSFRQLYYQDSTIIRLYNDLYTNINTYVKISEQGDFNWQSFSGKPIRDLTEYYVEPKIIKLSEKLNYGAGIKLLSLKTYFYKFNEKEKESDYFSIGPIVELKYLYSENLMISLKGNYEFIKTNNKDREQTTLYIRMLWEL